METETCPDLDIDVRPENVSTDFLQVLQVIRPEWNASKVEFEQSKLELSRGLLNTMVKCYNRDCPKDAIMIRVHNVKMSQFMKRKAEVACIKAMKPLHCAPNILATFNTGFCYEYIHGEILTALHLRQDPIWRLIAEDLAKFHSVTLLDGEELTGEIKMKQFIDIMLNGYPTELADKEKDHRMKTELPSIDTIKKELDIAQEEMLKTNSPIVLCHNDTRAENIVWQADTETINFVDFEAMNYSYQAMELANHFARYAGLDDPDMSLIPSEDFQMRWLNVYLRKYYECKGFNPDNVTPTDVRRLYVQVQKHYLYLLISAALSGPAMEANIFGVEINGLDFMSFSINFCKEYFIRKQEILDLKMPDDDDHDDSIDSIITKL